MALCVVAIIFYHKCCCYTNNAKHLQSLIPPKLCLRYYFESNSYSVFNFPHFKPPIGATVVGGVRRL